MEIPSSRRSRHTPPRRISPRSLAKTIARDETNMSTFDCTRKLPQQEHALVLNFQRLLFLGKTSLNLYLKEEE